jgi:acyl-CoA thioester hydrolase
MAIYEKTPESKMKIRFHDCDPFNHLNNSRYIDYIVTARGDQLLDNYQFDIYQLAREKQVGWVSAQTQISYLVPAYLMEEVTIVTRLLAYGEKRLLFEGLMWNQNKTVLKAVMWVKLVHFHFPTQRSYPHSANLLQFFEQIVHPVSGAENFDARVRQLNQKA